MSGTLLRDFLEFVGYITKALHPLLGWFILLFCQQGAGDCDFIWWVCTAVVPCLCTSERGGCLLIIFRSLVALLLADLLFVRYQGRGGHAVGVGVWARVDHWLIRCRFS